MALEGTIKDFGLPDIFQLIGLQRKTGILTLRNERETVTVTFENGLVVNADSSSKRLEDHLGYVLVKQGKLARERLEEALQLQKATLQRLGHVLVSHHFITPKDLKDALQVQVSQIVFKLFRWRDGEYHFGPTNSVDFDRENFSPMSPDFILMEGIRMVDEWPIIEKKIPSMDIVFRAMIDPGLIEIHEGGDGTESAFGALEEPKKPAQGPSSRIRLSPQEERIFRRVDGARTVQMIIDSTGLSEFDVCRTLFELLNRNIIAPVGRSTARARVFESETVPAPSMVPAYVVGLIVVLISLTALVVHLREPFAVTGMRLPLFAESQALTLEWKNHVRLERLHSSIRAYVIANRKLPDSLDRLIEARIVERSQTIDPWGRPYRYLAGPRDYSLSVETD
ncbi:MAG: DUF4388 domain-containing protein [Vicinamibacteria bacterium]|nr:DUF4388 domain-containing protein [Vicinamibacteria bacterium]